MTRHRISDGSISLPARINVIIELHPERTDGDRRLDSVSLCLPVRRSSARALQPNWQRILLFRSLIITDSSIHFLGISLSPGTVR